MSGLSLLTGFLVEFHLLRFSLPSRQSARTESWSPRRWLNVMLEIRTTHVSSIYSSQPRDRVRHLQVLASGFCKTVFSRGLFWVASNYLLADAPRVNLNVPYRGNRLNELSYFAFARVYQTGECFASLFARGSTLRVLSWSHPCPCFLHLRLYRLQSLSCRAHSIRCQLRMYCTGGILDNSARNRSADGTT